MAVDGSGNLYIADSSRLRRMNPKELSRRLQQGLTRLTAWRWTARGTSTFADTDNHRIRKVDTLGTITTVAGTGSTGYGLGGFSGDGGMATAAQLDSPWDVAVDSSGNVYIADWGNHRIRKVDISGTITTFAGAGTGFDSDGTGPATEALLNLPGGVAVDSSGNVYIADWGNHRIRKVDTSGTITTITGNGVQGFGGDGGPGTRDS